MAGACYLLISNRGVLSGAGDALFIKAVPWVVLVVFAAGMVLGARPAQPLPGDTTPRSAASAERRSA